MSTRARSRESGEWLDMDRREVVKEGRGCEVEFRGAENERCEVERKVLRTEKEWRDAEVERREVVEAGTTLMSCEVDRLDVEMGGAVLGVCKEFLYAALDFRIGFSGTTEL